MRTLSPALLAPALLTLALLAAPALAGTPAEKLAEKIIANCTGMLNFDIYEIDTALPEQEVAGIGKAVVDIDAERILLTGTFGEYRFDLKRGTLYQDDRDTGIYCTYSRSAG